MGKNRVRLTESQLHKVIKESVKRVLRESVNELDWKTYMNAAKKAREMGKKWNDQNGNNPRANKFERQARIQFAKDHGYDFGEPIEGYDNFGFDEEQGRYYIPDTGEIIPHHKEFYPCVDDDYSEYYLDDIEPLDCGKGVYRRSTHVEPDPKHYDTYRFDEHGLDKDGFKPNPYDQRYKFFYDSYPCKKNGKEEKLFADKKEIDDYNNDKYEYVKGTGWQLK